MYSAFPFWTMGPPTVVFDSPTARTTSASVTPRAELARIDVDLILDGIAADARDLGHARHGAELRSDVPVLQGAQPAEVEPASLDRVPVDLPGGEGIGRRVGHHAVGKDVAGLRQALEHALACGGEVDVVGEDHVDHREVKIAR